MSVSESRSSSLGKFFIIRKGKIGPHYDSFETAYNASQEMYEEDDFIIQEVEPEDTVNFVFGAK